MFSVLLVTFAISKIFCLTILSDFNCIKNNTIFKFQESITTSFIIYHHDDLFECFSEIMKHYSNEEKIIEVYTIKQEKEAFSNKLLKISSGHTIFLFWEVADIQKFINKQFILLSHTSSTVFLFVIKNCDNFEILSVWWMRFKNFNLLAYCLATNRLFLYNPFIFTTLQWNLTNITDLQSVFIKDNNFYGYPFSIYVFERIPTALSLENVPKTLLNSATYKELLKLVPYAGIDGFMLAELTKTLNFTSEFVLELTDRVAYGEIFENGSGNGLLGSITSGESDIGANGLYIKDYRTDKLDFLFSYTGINMCFVVPKAGAVPSWKLVFSCFTKLSWSFLFFIVVLLSVLWYFLEGTLFEKRYGIFYVIQLFLSTTSKKASALISKRLLILACLYLNIIIASIFQGSLVTSYTKTVFYKDLNTLEDIDKSGLLISTCITNVLGVNLTGVRKSLESKRVKTKPEKSIERAAYKRDCCAIERKSDAEFYIESIFVSDDGIPLLHITDVCDLSYPVAMAVVKGFPFANTFNKIISRFVEGGFIGKWNQDVTYSITAHRRLRKNGKTSSGRVIGIKDVQAAFYILNIGLVISFIVFVLEILKNV